MKLPLTITVYVELDEIETIIDEIKSLQTYKLSEKDEMLLVSREAVTEILAKHVKAQMEGREL